MNAFEYTAQLKKRVSELTECNNHTEATVLLVKTYGSEAEEIDILAIQRRHDMLGSIAEDDQIERDRLFKKYLKFIK